MDSYMSSNIDIIPNFIQLTTWDEDASKLYININRIDYIKEGSIEFPGCWVVINGRLLRVKETYEYIYNSI